MKDKGDEDNLVTMFLSGMGGTRKGEAIKTFIEFFEGVSIFFDWNYDVDVINVMTYTMQQYVRYQTEEHCIVQLVYIVLVVHLLGEIK